VAEPVADLGDVGSVFEGVGGGCGAEAVGTDGSRWDAGGDCVMLDDVGVYRRDGQRAVGGTPWVSNRSEEGSSRITAVTCGVEVFFEERGGGRVYGEVSNPGALSVYGEARDATTRSVVGDAELTKLPATEGVVEEDGENGSVSFAFERIRGRSLEKSLGLGIGERRCLALVGAFGGTFHSVYWIRCDGVLVREEIEEFREGRESAANARWCQVALAHLSAPGDDVGSRDCGKSVGIF
jgi:hypothetical protein